MKDDFLSLKDWLVLSLVILLYIWWTGVPCGLEGCIFL